MARHCGFTYMGMLALIAIMGLGAAVAGDLWHLAAQREREAELLHIGNEYRKAIQRYLGTGMRRYPKRLEDLVEDPRFADRRRHLRRLYRDPITGKAEWGLVPSPDGGIAGIYSLSAERPLKQGRFRERDAAFENARRYSDWRFTFPPAPRGAPPG